MGRIGPAGLFDRDRELSAVGALLDDAVSGAGGLLLVEGEAGIGKTGIVRAAECAGAGQWTAGAEARGAASWSPGSLLGWFVRCSPNRCAPPTPTDALRCSAGRRL